MMDLLTPVFVVIDAAYVVAVGTALSLVIAACGTVLVAVVNLKRETRASAELQAAAQAKTNQTLERVSQATDGNLTILRNEIAMARQEIAALKGERERLAVNAALATPPPAAVDAEKGEEDVEAVPSL